MSQLLGGVFAGRFEKLVARQQGQDVRVADFVNQRERRYSNQCSDQRPVCTPMSLKVR